MALSCGCIALLSLYAAITALPAAGTMELLRGGVAVPAAQRQLAAAASIRAGSIFERGRYFTDAALAANRLSDAARKQALGGMTLPSVIDQALANAPASPHNWTRRAEFLLAAGDYQAAGRAIETSLLLGRFVPRLTMPRLHVMVALLRVAPNPALLRDIEDQIRIAARTEPAALARFAHSGMAEGIAQRILHSDLELYGPYLQNLMRVRAAADRAARAGTR